VVNWLIKPFTMAALGVLFFRYVFAPWVDPQSASEYIAGMILLGVAPCTAMVFVWSQLVKGDANYTLVQVSVNDLIMVVCVCADRGLSAGRDRPDRAVGDLVLSTVLYVVLPLVAGMATRATLARRSRHAVATSLPAQTLVHRRADRHRGAAVRLSGRHDRGQAGVIGLIAIPLILQTYGIFAISFHGRALDEAAAQRGYRPACLIGTSNFFELAVAVAISLFGLNSGAALATVVGVLVEVPVMLTGGLVNRTQHWFPSERA
jgi:ACR3 family arsenite transporter